MNMFPTALTFWASQGVLRGYGNITAIRHWLVLTILQSGSDCVSGGYGHFEFQKIGSERGPGELKKNVAGNFLNKTQLHRLYVT